jgi:hypothetical protein
MRVMHAARAIRSVVLVGAVVGAALALADEKPRDSGKQAAPPRAPAAATRPTGPAKVSRPTIYVPPSRGAVGARTGGGTRGAANAPRIAVLVPDHVGLTTRDQPTLAWFLAADTDLAAELTLLADGAVEPSKVIRLGGPLRAGIHLVDLAAHGARIEEGKTYDWYVALVVDPDARDEDLVAGGAIQRHAVTPELAKDLAGGEPSYRVLARHGIWYDAIADLSKAIAGAPAATDAGRELRDERAALLEQVGVGAAAVYDREGG